MILYEIRKQTSRLGSVQLVSKEELENLTGFRSVYGFCEQAIQHIKDTDTTAGLKGMELYSDELLVDFDNQPDEADDFEILLSTGLLDYPGQNQVSYSKYDSGGRSIHFHIPIEPMKGTTVPESHKAFMERVAPLADMSVYKTSGMFRLPGTFHHKNPGKYKKLLYKSEGSLLHIPMIGVEIAPIPFVTGQQLDSDSLEYILMRMLVTKVVEGTTGRNTHVFRIAATCRDLGISSVECENLILQWNVEYCKPPLMYPGIRSTINSAYRKVV